MDSELLNDIENEFRAYISRLADGERRFMAMLWRNKQMRRHALASALRLGETTIAWIASDLSDRGYPVVMLPGGIYTLDFDALREVLHERLSDFRALDMQERRHRVLSLRDAPGSLYRGRR